MNDQNDPHPADKILGDDWRPPQRVQMEQAWANLEPSKKERLTRLQREHWKEKLSLDHLPGEQEIDAWVMYELCPPDPYDEAPPERTRAPRRGTARRGAPALGNVSRGCRYWRTIIVAASRSRSTTHRR